MTTENKDQFSTMELQILLQIIDACATRGAFRGEELAVVGQMRNKIELLIPKETEPKIG